MKLITDCCVAVVGHTVFTDHPTYDIPDDGTDVERLGAFAAKGCYDSFSKEGRSCIANQKQIIQFAHGSVLEHSYVSLFVEGITRGLSLELNRHRTFGISQRSTRYTKEEDASLVLEPYYASLWLKHGLVWEDYKTVYRGKVRENDFTSADHAELCLVESHVTHFKRSLDQYSREIEALEDLNPRQLSGMDLRKWARGKARNSIPHGLETRGTWTANFRAWRWFIEARSSRHAEAEIRRLADHVLQIIRPLAPTYFSDFQLKGVVDNIPEWVPLHSKV